MSTATATLPTVPSNEATVERCLRLARKLGWSHPFFLPLLSRSTVVADASVQTAAVTTRGKIMVSPAFFATLTDAEVAGVMAHELCHPALGHFDRAAGRPMDKWNIATDMAINAGLRAAGITLPKGALYPEKGLEEASAEEIYATLPKEEQEEKTKGKEKQEEKDGGEKSEEQGEGIADGQGQGQGGAGEGEARPAPGQGCGVVVDPTETADEDARSWRAAAYEAKELARAAGDKAFGALARIIEIPPSRVSWEQVLRGATAQAAGAHGRDDVSFSRRNRRSPQIGAQLPGWRAMRPRVGVLIDSSASVDEAALTRAVVETAKIAKTTGASIYLVIHSTRVQFAGWLSRNTTATEVMGKVSDRGGTRFVPAYAALAAAGRFDTVVHLTDGEACDNWPMVRGLVVALVGSSTKQYIPAGARVVEAAI